MTDKVDLTERTLGEFRMLRKLGAGGMADVYLAEQTSLGRYVAVKVMRPSAMSKNEVMIARFKQEAMAAAGLNHPNIIQVYTIGEQDGLHFIAQEYVEGKNLAEFLREKGPPDLSACLHIMRQVASALKAASEAGITHRDIKPENVMLTKRGEVKIADFGLAQLNRKSEDPSLTQKGTTMGTPLYMSPEQVMGKSLDHRCDIYSFGVSCYHMLKGAPPFVGKSAMEIAVQHVNTEPEPLKETAPHIPIILCLVVHKMMEKNPEDRYQSADEIQRDVRTMARALRDTGNLDRVQLPAFEGQLITDASRGEPTLKPLAPGEEPQRSPSKTPAAGMHTPTGQIGLKQQDSVVDRPAATAPSKPAVTGKAASSKSTKPANTAPAAEERPARQPVAPGPGTSPKSRHGRRRKREESVDVLEVVPKKVVVDLEEDDEYVPRPTATEFDDMDLTPMVDVTFLLLIFFMITASFSLQKSMEIPAPDPDEQGAAQQIQTLEDMQQDSVIVEIDEDNIIFVDYEPLADKSRLEDKLRDKLVNEQKNELVLEANSEAWHENVVFVFDAAQEVGFENMRQVLRK